MTTGLIHVPSVSLSGTDAAEWDKNTWGPLENLARNHPGAGVHFQGKKV
jgi:D-amino-acid oxidase